MAQVLFPITSYQDPDGNPLINGYLLINISDDVQTPTGQLGYRSVARVNLDQDGNTEGTALFWPTTELVPNDRVYILRGFTEAGQLVLGPIGVAFSTGPNIDGFGAAFGMSFGS